MEALATHEKAEARQRENTNRLHHLAGEACAALPDDALLLPVAEETGDGMDTWMNKSASYMRNGKHLVSASDAEFPKDGPQTKYEALQDPRRCFDALRRGFFVEGNESRRSAMRDWLWRQHSGCRATNRIFANNSPQLFIKNSCRHAPFWQSLWRSARVLWKRLRGHHYRHRFISASAKCCTLPSWRVRASSL